MTLSSGSLSNEMKREIRMEREEVNFCHAQKKRKEKKKSKQN
jgi:hypothetical protein